ncbi:STAS domain-containing protein [Streptomyces sp. HMX87]|uniref:STAS domain-containing protein n=1 Tax=Streptomyces sp. HMX87 TaxID=3390849 RepID=UPI003A8AB4D1
MTSRPNPCEPLTPPGYALLPLPAEIDFCNAADLLPRVLAVADAHADRLRVLVLDLTGTDFMDTQGARLVGDVCDHLRDRARVRVVAAPQGVPSRVLELTGLRRDVPVYDNLTEALGPV